MIAVWVRVILMKRLAHDWLEIVELLENFDRLATWIVVELEIGTDFKAHFFLVKLLTILEFTFNLEEIRIAFLVHFIGVQKLGQLEVRVGPWVQVTTFFGDRATQLEDVVHHGDDLRDRLRGVLDGHVELLVTKVAEKLV